MSDAEESTSTTHPPMRPAPMPLRSAQGAHEAGGGFGSGEVIGLGLTLLWGLMVGGFFLLVPEGDGAFDPITFVMVLFAIFMPVALIWIGVAAAKSSRIMREESARLRAAVDALRSSYVTQSQGGASEGRSSPIERKLEELVTAQRNAEAALARIASRAGLAAEVPLPGKPALSRPEPAAEAEAQPTFDLGTPATSSGDPISVEEFTRALNFPENEKDKAGFAALRKALREPKISGLVHSAQDVLTLLSEDGIYMDDLSPAPARPAVWRRFGKGLRGEAIAGMDGVRDRSCLALTAGRMRADPIFRDAVHHFLRKFDQTFAAFAETASDTEIIAVSETRTARAFMLLGKVSGTFD
ncbi:hypothetical protein FHY55_02195 [Oceanicola sp. D3]|uniref:hypothetical protein n=1 Tax=Oceanicola sp. D3 TaxID=2587163 RepID=UPI0011209735|nr:hypothetical protein [Oceanicola sp. D3]QDC08123.1 hypothetical protein FHY55_02195 [Oceanicola sp. D3]